MTGDPEFNTGFELSLDDVAFLAVKALAYRKLQNNHLEMALRVVRMAAKNYFVGSSQSEFGFSPDDAVNRAEEGSQHYCGQTIAAQGEGQSGEIQNELRKWYLIWLRSNFYHLLGRFSQAQSYYSMARQHIERLEARYHAKDGKDRVVERYGFFKALLLTDQADLFWNSEISDMAREPYGQAVSLFRHGPPRDMVNAEALKDHLEKVFQKHYVHSSDQGLRSAPDIDVDHEKEIHEMLQKKMVFAALRHIELQKHHNWKTVRIEAATLLSGDESSKNSGEISFLIGQSYALGCDYEKAIGFFLKAVTEKGPEDDVVHPPKYIFSEVSLDKAVKDSLLKRAVGCYLLSKLMIQIPLRKRNETKVEWRNFQTEGARALEKTLQELNDLSHEIEDFIAPQKNDQAVIDFLGFLRESVFWAKDYYMAGTSEPEKKERLLQKLSYTLANSYFFFKNFPNRKKEFEDDIYSKLYTPAVNVVPRSGNLFAVLKRWNSVSPMITRGRKFAVTLKETSWPEDLCHGFEMASHVYHHPESKGGGYFLRWNGYGVVIDPGVFFFENFLEFFSFRDIDLVVVTHDHPDHQMDMKSLLALMSESRKAKKREKRINFWIDPASCAEFYTYILRLQSLEEQREQEEKSECKSESEYTPRLIGNVYPFYKDDSNEQESKNSVNQWTIPEVGIAIRAIYNEKHKTLMAPKQSFGILLKLRSNGEPEATGESEVPAPPQLKMRSIYITGDGGYSKDNVRWLKSAMKSMGIQRLDILVGHLGSIIDGDLTDIKKFSEGIYQTHLGMRGMVEIVGQLNPKLTIISEWGEELDSHRKAFCNQVHFLREFRETKGTQWNVQPEERPQKILPGDIGLVLLFRETEQGANDKPDFICRLCFSPCKLDELYVHTSGQELLYVCEDCAKIFYDWTPGDSTKVDLVDEAKKSVMSMGPRNENHTD